MTAQIFVALAVTLLSACALNVGYLLEHSAVAALPRLDWRRPLRSSRLLVGNGRWLTGFLAEFGGWGLYVLALALAPLSLVQATAAGGVGILAVLSARITRIALSRREWGAVAVAVAGLALLGISLVGGHGEGAGASYLAVGIWLAGSTGAVASVLRLLPPLLGAGAAFGAATGVLFAAGDVATKSAVEGGGHVVFVAALVACYAAGTAILQAGFQHGSPLTTAGIATLLTNALPIVAGMTIFGEPLPSGPLGAVRVAAFVAVLAGAFFLGERKHGRRGAAGAARPGAEMRPAAVRDRVGAPWRSPGTRATLLARASKRRRSEMRGTIVCGVSGEIEAAAAAQAARAVADRLGLRLVLVHVVDGGTPAEDDGLAPRQRHARGEELLRELCRGAGGGAEGRILAGDRADALAQVAAEEGADLIVIGSRSAGLGKRKLSCGLARELEAATPVPVVVAPPATRGRLGRRLAVAEPVRASG